MREEKCFLPFGSKFNMSKIAKVPVVIKEGIKFTQEGGIVRVDGPKGSLSFNSPSEVNIKMEDGKLTFTAKDAAAKNSKAMLGLVRATVANMVKGVGEGFEKRLELSGVGYRAQVAGEDLILSVGYSHPVKFTPVAGVEFAVVEGEIIVSGIDKTLVGNIAAKIREVRPPDPYKGKGVKYKGEKIRKKAGKAAAKTTGAK